MNKPLVKVLAIFLLITLCSCQARFSALQRTSKGVVDAFKHQARKNSALAFSVSDIFEQKEVYAADSICEKPIVVLDCCGSVGDPESKSPIGPFLATYKKEGVPITEKEARAPMGIGKWDHIKQIPVLSPAVARHWLKIKGAPMADEDVDRMFIRYKPLQVEAVKNMKLIPGAVATLIALKKMGISYIGGTTGFFREAAQAFGKRAVQQGFHFNNIVCTDDTGGKGRPAKDQKKGGYEMLLESMNRAGITEPRLVIKAGDSEGDIEEGRRIKEVYGESAWTIGFYMTGTYFPFTQEEIDAMDPAEFAHHVNYAKYRLGRANILIPSIAELPEAVEWIISLNALGISPFQYNEDHDLLKDKLVR